MTPAEVSELIRGISTDHIVAFFVVLARITPLFVIAPVFSSQLLIPRVRSVLAVGMAIGLTPLASHGETMPTGFLAVAALMAQSALVGFALAFACACMFAAVQGAGVLADALSGFSYGQSVDPINGNPGGAMTNLYSMIGIALFLAIGGDAWVLRGLDATFHAVPLNQGPNVSSLLAGAESMLASVTLGAVEIVAPLMLAIIIADVAFGMVSKVVPQLNVFAVGFPLKVGIALLMVSVSLPFIAGWMSSQLETSVTVALHTLRVG